MPFFAVVAAPITALNFQDFAALNFGRLPRVDRSWKAWSLGGRIVSILAGAILIAAAWPGWLHGRPTDDVSQHRVAWNPQDMIHVDPSLREPNPDDIADGSDPVISRAIEILHDQSGSKRQPSANLAPAA